DGSRTIVVATHQVEEIEHVLTDVLFMDRGRIVFELSTEALESRYRQVTVRPDQLAAARAEKPLYERQVLGQSVLLFDGGDPRRLAARGGGRAPSLAGLFVALLAREADRPRGAAP